MMYANWVTIQTSNGSTWRFRAEERVSVVHLSRAGWQQTKLPSRQVTVGMYLVARGELFKIVRA